MSEILPPQKRHSFTEPGAPSVLDRGAERPSGGLPIRLGFWLIEMICRLPLPWLLWLGRGAGALFGRFAVRRRHIIRTNLGLCFPKQSAAEREQLVDAHFEALGMGVFETLLAGVGRDDHLRPNMELVGLEHLDAAHADGSGVLLLTGHFTTMELAARALCLAARPFHAMYRPLQSSGVNGWMRFWRESHSQRPALPKDDLKCVVRALRAGGALWYGPDQTIESSGSAFVPFFGVPALTLTATSRLAQMGRARVVPFYPERVNGRYRVTFLPALDSFPSGDDFADTQRIVALLETAILRCPEQYFWIHRRFKYQPPGADDVYRKREAA